LEYPWLTELLVPWVFDVPTVSVELIPLLHPSEELLPLVFVTESVDVLPQDSETDLLDESE
jgi:hypothetical protein